MAKTKTNADNGDKSSPPAESATASSTGPTPVLPPDSDNISTRVGSRTKKAKVVFDPSDNYVPRKRVRKTDLPLPETSVSSSSVKSEAVVPKSPAKSDGLSDSNNGIVSKPRSAPSPTGAKQSTGLTYRPKVLGSGPSIEGARLAGLPGTSLDTVPARKYDFKREPNCDMCHKVEQQRRGFKLIDCSNCAFRAHSKCLRAHPVYQKFPIKLNFRCFQCIECVVCGKSLRGGNLLFCCDCQNAFHANCHGPTMSSNSNSNSLWVCKRCMGERSPVKQSLSQEKPPVIDRPDSDDNADDEAHQDFAGFSDNEIRKDSFSLSDSAAANDSIIQPEEDDDEEEADEEADLDETVEGNDEENEEKFDPRLDNFENIQNWSCDDVYRYFKHYFPDYAHLFKEQEIDGPSLVLMRKSDILSGFGLKLGPAIALYQRIVMMQNNDRDFRLTWI